MKKALIFFTFAIGLSISSKAQSVAYYPFRSILSVSTNPDLRVWGDLRFQTNSFFSSLSTEIAPAININQNQKGRFYLGGGIRLNYLASFQDGDIFEGYFFNVGVRSAPFEKYPQVQVAFELSPYVASDFESGLFRTRLGVAYNFSRKSN
ncbi:hypothetical protein [uncultured Arcticibacterium sp.]|uniref:hypothetical protein n=1 Tax=uncultured Arcticibacterium sp. TaxID=2173042 RepID=UPI0030F9B7A2